MKRIYLLLALLVSLAGCSILNDVGQYASDNPLIVNAAVRQAVFRYIDAGNSEAAKNARARGVIEVVQEVDTFLEGNPTASVSTLLAVAQEHIPWGNLEIADRLLVEDILAMVRLSLEQKQSEGLLDPDAVVGLRAILQTAVSTAALL